MQKYLILLFVALAFSSCKEKEIELQAVSLIPKPQSLQINEGYWELNHSSTIVYDLSNKEVGETVQYFQDLIKKSCGFELKVVEYQAGSQIENGISLILSDTCKAIGSEGYYFSSNSDGVQIVASTPTGIFYGIQSLRQLFPAEFESDHVVDARWIVPAVQIRDEPRFVWRGMLLDCCRHFMEPAFVKRYIDLLAYHKMNRFHWHLTEDQGWRIEIKKYPKLTEVGAYRIEEDGTRYGGFYTQDEIREIVEYARIRHIEVVPEIELPGHSVAAIATFPHLSCTGDSIQVANRWGVFKDIYCAGNDRTFEFLQDVFDEVITLFPYSYIHIGGDEAPKYRWENCASCQQRIKDEKLKDEAHLQTYFITRIERYLAEKDRKIIGWDEILEGGLSPTATVQSWRGFDGAIEAARHGHYAVLSPTSHCYFDYPLESIDLQKVYQFNPIPAGLEPEYHGFILGGECNMWTERAPQELVDDRMFPRILAMSEVLWTSPNSDDFPEFHQRVQLHYKKLDLLGVKYGFESKAISFVVKPAVSGEGLEVELIAGQPGFEVHYSLDGSMPGLESPKYNGAVSITRDTKLRAITLKAEGGPSYLVEPMLYIHKALMKPISFRYPYNPNYTGGGEFGLVDGVGGSDNFRDNRWQGFFGSDMEVTINLTELKTLSVLKTNFLQSSLSWIYMPREVLVEGSVDGLQFKEIGQIKIEEDPRSARTFTKGYEIELEQVSVQFVRITAKSFGKNPDWHDAAGADTWVFCDEIALY